MNISKEDIIGQVVAGDYRTAAVFQSHGIDFCCKGNRTINEVCEEKNIEAGNLVYKLQKAALQTNDSTNDYQSWDIDLLADYIEKKHHRYVETKIPEIKAYLQKIVSVHGGRHPELKEIEQLFSASARELLAHMTKEELVLFPYIRQMVEAKERNTELNAPHFGTVNNPIQMMMQEHDNEGSRFRKIAALSNNYTPPEDACNTYRVAFSLVKEFEEDLHLHIHLENNILFPKAIELEKQYQHNYA